jgi:ATP-dependent Clp protease protease subunit
MTSKKCTADHCHHCAEPEPEEDFVFPPIIMPPATPQIRTIGLYGEIAAEKGMEAVYSLFAMRETGKDLDPETDKETFEPIEFIICTGGGSAADMFAIYDAMRVVRKDCDITTIGLGEVMSAGVLLLASGTRGKRKIGANCRLMLHSVSAGHHGSIFSLENEFDEFKWVQEKYFAALAAESKLKPRQIKKILDQKMNVYFDAQQALKYGIVDEII